MQVLNKINAEDPRNPRTQQEVEKRVLGRMWETMVLRKQKMSREEYCLVVQNKLLQKATTRQAS